MRSDAILGVVLGILLAGVSIAGNIWRGDSHVVSMFPDLMSFLIAPVFLFIVLRRRHKEGMVREALQRYGRIIVTISAVLFAVFLSAFAMLWFSAPTAFMLFFTLAGTCLSACMVGYLSVEVSARVLTRAT